MIITLDIEQKRNLEVGKRDPLMNSYNLLKRLKINRSIITKIEKKQTFKINNAFKFAENSNFQIKRAFERYL